jgi:hypothetical protein
LADGSHTFFVRSVFHGALDAASAKHRSAAASSTWTVDTTPPDGVGATLEVRVTAAKFVGKVVRYRVIKRAFPLGRSLCLAPGVRKPMTCTG